jgi:hypothetical protein
MIDASLNPDGSTITLFVLMASRRAEGHRGATGLRRLGAAEDRPRARQSPGACAPWQRLLEAGRFGTLAELADAERISKSYFSRILRLTLLAPHVVERILDRRPTAGPALFLQPFPVEWEGQRAQFLCNSLE